jgi:general secretion pathway protein K
MEYRKVFGKQSGIALITVLLIVALATITAVAMTSRQQFDIRRTAQMVNTDQAYFYAIGGEEWAKLILQRDAAKNTVDHNKEIWALPLPPTLVSGGSLQGQIEDLQSRFNINNLVFEGQVSEENFKYFKRLLTILELPPQLAEVAVDWIDSDSTVLLPYGAEDESYLIEIPPYRTANTLFRSISELQLLFGVDLKIYEKLIPYIIALPTVTTININTASQPLIMALSENALNEWEVNNLILERYEHPFENKQDFLAHTALAGISIPTALISVSSDYFLFSAQIDIDSSVIHLQSILHRSASGVSTIFRSQSGTM